MIIGQGAVDAKQSHKLFPEVHEIVGVLSQDSDQEIVILIIPSHDKKDREIGEERQAMWAAAGSEMLADLYRGATAFVAYSGIFKTEEGQYLRDKPIVLESYANNHDIEDPEKLNELLRFMKRMGKETDQDTVMVIIGTRFFYIDDFSGV